MSQLTRFGYFPVNTKHENNVVSMSLRCIEVDMTLFRRHVFAWLSHTHQGLISKVCLAKLT